MVNRHVDFAASHDPVKNGMGHVQRFACTHHVFGPALANPPALRHIADPVDQIGTNDMLLCRIHQRNIYVVGIQYPAYLQMHRLIKRIQRVGANRRFDDFPQRGLDTGIMGQLLLRRLQFLILCE